MIVPPWLIAASIVPTTAAILSEGNTTLALNANVKKPPFGEGLDTLRLAYAPHDWRRVRLDIDNNHPKNKPNKIAPPPSRNHL